MRRTILVCAVFGLAACSGATPSQPIGHLSSPDEVLITAPKGILYLGDDYPCSIESEAVLRYAGNRALAMCENGVWREIIIEGR